jgi:hypothetical protein
MSMRRISYLLWIVLAALPLSLRAADDAVVTERNLLERERYWPYHVTLTKPFVPLPAGSRGVLIRVESVDVARIDFGRDGLHQVPVASTDLVAHANGIRRGELVKKAPNFVLAIAPRLVDTSASTPVQYSFERAGKKRGFLAVFADPAADDFPQLAEALAPLEKREGLLTILFPQGAHPDPMVFEKVRATGWNAAFVYSHLTEPYTRSLLPKDAPRPALLLQTPEGRVLFQSGWREDAVAELQAALDRALGAES